jgi:pyruvate carboxylase subunit B
MKYYAEWGGRTHVVEIVSGKEGTTVLVDGVPHAVDLAAVEGTGLHSLLLDDKSFAFAARFENGTAVLSFHDREVRVPVEDERTRETRRMTAGGRRARTVTEVRSVMPGVVKEVRVAAGQKVAAQAPLLVLEAMKMENEIRAPGAGVVGTVHVKPGDAVEKGALLVTFAPPSNGGSDASVTEQA